MGLNTTNVRLRRLTAAGFALLAGGASTAWVPTASAAPAESGANVYCDLLDEASARLHSDIDAGVGGLRIVMKQGYWTQEMQQSGTEEKLDILTDGAAALRELNAGGAIPGLAPLLGELDAAVGKAKTDTEGLFYVGVVHPYAEIKGPLSMRHPITPAYWATLDHVSDVSGQIDSLLDNLRDRGCE